MWAGLKAWTLFQLSPVKLVLAITASSNQQQSMSEIGHAALPSALFGLQVYEQLKMRLRRLRDFQSVCCVAAATKTTI
jgi:hypothetical protein